MSLTGLPILKESRGGFLDRSAVDSDPQKKKRFEAETGRMWTVLVVGSVLLAFAIILLIYLETGSAAAQRTIVLFSLTGAAASMIALFLSVMVFITSLKAEIFATSSFDLARRSAHSQTHLFRSFREQLEWVLHNISPKEFSNLPVNLRIGISTPAYGIGVLEGFDLVRDSDLDSASLDLWIQFLETWLMALQASETLEEPSTLDITIWNPENHVETFGFQQKSEEIRTVALNYVRRISEIFSGFYQLHLEGKVRLTLAFSEKTDARVFLARHRGHYSGLLTVFSPLNEERIDQSNWVLAGFSVYDGRGYQQLRQFFERLPLFTDSDTGSAPIISEVTTELASAESFFLQHFGLQPEPGPE